MGGSSKTTQSNTVDPQLMSMYTQNYANASKVADTPFQAYGGELTAPLNSTQQQAAGLLTGISNNQTGQSDLDSAKSTVSGILNGSGVTAGQLSNTDLTPYLNPFTSDVINSTLSDQERAREIQRVADNQSATANNAFGGSRQGVADSLTNAAYDRNTGSLLAGLNQSNFTQAQGAASTDITNRLNADQFNTNTQLSGANALAGYSSQDLQEALQRAGAVGTVGDAQQQTQQAQDSALYAEFLRQIQDPLTKQTVANQALGIIPQQTQQTSTTTQSGSLGGILGGVGSLASGLGALGGSGGLTGLLALSDGRTKADVQTLRHDARGRRWVAFRYKWEPIGTIHEGVIAQEVMRTDPGAVHLGSDGYYRVDYGALKEMG